MKAEILIREVNNGYLIYDEAGEMRGRECAKYVAHTIDDANVIVKQLANAKRGLQFRRWIRESSMMTEVSETEKPASDGWIEVTVR